MEELIVDYESGALHPGDLKPALSKSLNQILQVMLTFLRAKEKRELVI